jgi:hypothetical protein
LLNIAVLNNTIFLEWQRGSVRLCVHCSSPISRFKPQHRQKIFYSSFQKQNKTISLFWHVTFACLLQTTEHLLQLWPLSVLQVGFMLVSAETNQTAIKNINCLLYHLSQTVWEGENYSTALFKPYQSTDPINTFVYTQIFSLSLKSPCIKLKIKRVLCTNHQAL